MSTKTLYSRIINRLGRDTSANNEKLVRPGSDDYYLVSYPRSGNTWMRTLIANVLYGESGDSIADLQKYVPDLHHKIVESPALRSTPRIFKSHFSNCYLPPIGGGGNRYKNVVYIVRDPRDVALSYYRYLANFRKEETDFSSFLTNWLNGRIWPCSWREHVDSWTAKRPDLNLNICVLRYEDLLSDTISELSRVIGFMGVQASHQVIERAVSDASVENLKLKAIKKMPEHERSEKQVFIGKASNRQWINSMNDDHRKSISDYCSRTMAAHHYID
ncbi:MAG: sulfotransferase domain-containing protein [Cyanobacteria bacterium J06560_6]